MLREIERNKKSGVVSINGITYAVGLMWEPADDPERAMKEAYSVAKSEGVDADLLCLRISTPPQYGLGWASVGHFAGGRPLAAAVTENVGGNYIGAFQIADKWWLGTSKNDIILPYGDAFYDSEEEIRQMMLKILPDVGLDTIKFAPTSWGLKDTKDTPLDKLITNQIKLKLSQVDSLLSRGKNLLVAAIVIGIASYMLYGYLSEKISSQKALKERRRQEIAKAKNYEDPWKKAPTPLAFINSCSESFSSLPINLFGWSIPGADCDGYTVKAGIDKKGGFIYDLKNKTDGSFDLNLDGAGKTALITKRLDRLPARTEYKTGSDLWSGDIISQQFLDLKSKIGIDVKLSGVSMKNAEPRAFTDENGDSVVLPPVNNAVSFSFTTTYPLESWVGYLSAFPGLLIDSVNVTFGSSISWAISGKVYQK